jgi:hypothetical protein
VLGRGIAHECEPEDFDNGRAFDGDSWSGCMWECDGPPDDPMPTVGDFLESARDTHGLEVTAELAAWVAAGRPSARDDASQVEACLLKALRAGHDIYDSDTRSYIFAKAERVNCRACPECREETERQYFGGSPGKLLLWNGKEIELDDYGHDAFGCRTWMGGGFVVTHQGSPD